MLDSNSVSTGEFLRSAIELRGWKKPRKNEFRFRKSNTEITDLGIVGLMPKRAIDRGQVHPNLSFLLLPRSISDFPPIFDTENNLPILWSWSQGELTGKGPRLSPGAAAIKDGSVYTQDILNLVGLFESAADQFNPSQTADHIMRGEVQSTRAGSLGVIALLIIDDQQGLAFEIARKISQDVKKSIEESESPDNESAILSARFSLLFAYFNI